MKRLDAPGHYGRRDGHAMAPRTDGAASWSVRRRTDVVEVGYGSGTHFPQYAALHTGSGFLRLNYGPDSTWGTSVVLPPSFWLAGRYHQGAALAVDWRVAGRALLLTFTAAVANLRVRGALRLTPPGRDTISGTVTIEVDGAIEADRRPGEAFKLVSLTSMRISDRVWDVSSVEIGSRSFPIPANGWVVAPPMTSHRLAARGGSSSWKQNAPTVELTLARPCAMTGWVTPTRDRDDDNVAVWAAGDEMLTSWSYTVTAKP